MEGLEVGRWMVDDGQEGMAGGGGGSTLDGAAIVYYTVYHDNAIQGGGL
jgi:hypothetical protein